MNENGRQHAGWLASMTEAEFVARFGGLYESSPWVARETWRRGLADIADDLDELAARLAAAVEGAEPSRQLALIRAHPDLADHAAVAGGLTPDSSEEQASAGLDQCTPEEYERFQALNAAYRERFGFPYVMAVRGRSRREILQAFEERLHNEHRAEFRRALQEIHRIARLRLEQMVAQEHG